MNVFASLLICFDFYARQLYRQVLLRARISYGNSVCPSVCPGVTTRYRIKPRSDRDNGFSPYDSLEFLVSSEVNPPYEGVKFGYPLKRAVSATVH